MNYMFFDTETSGLPKNYKAPASDTDNWPRLIQLAYIRYDSEGECLGGVSTVIKPEGFTIPKVASDIHGIMTEMALKDGVPLKGALEEFREALETCGCMIGHNVQFDASIMGAEFVRNKIKFLTPKRRKICTMIESVQFCKIPGRFGKYKWPKLIELHKKLFGEEFDNQHDALADVEATARCFWKLVELGEIKL